MLRVDDSSPGGIGSLAGPPAPPAVPPAPLQGPPPPPPQGPPPMVPDLTAQNPPSIPRYNPPARVPRNNVNDVLRNSEQLPPISPNLPGSMRQLVHEFQSLQLERFEHANKRGWGNVRNQYSKRLYLFQRIKARAAGYRGAASFEQKLLRAADELDSTRGAHSMNAFLRLLKSSDPNTRRRNRESYRRS